MRSPDDPRPTAPSLRARVPGEGARLIPGQGGPGPGRRLVRVNSGSRAAVAVRGRPLTWHRVQRMIAPYVFISPGVVFYLMVTIIPMVWGFWISFHKWSIIWPAHPWVGLGNYTALLSEDLFWTSLRNTAIYTAGVVPVEVAVALMVALLLNTRLRGRSFYRLLYYLPVVTPLSISAVIWQWIYHPHVGLFNWVMRLLRLPTHDWLQEIGTAMLAVIIVAIWSGVGYRMVIFLAALQGIPQTYYEAAMIDGAGRFALFRYITLPLLKPATLFVLVTSIIGSFQVFSIVNVLTQGGPLDSTHVVVYYIYKRAFGDLQFGLAAAMSFVLFAIILVVTAIQWKLIGREVSYE